MTEVSGELRRLVEDAARSLAPAPSQVSQILSIFHEIGLRGVEGLEGTTEDDLAEIGVPFLFGKKLIEIAQGSRVIEGLDPRTRPRAAATPSTARIDVEDRRLMTRIPVKPYDLAFQPKFRLLGANGGNVRHIEEQSEASVDIVEDGLGRLRIEIRSIDWEVIEKAEALVQDLVDSVDGDYQRWLASRQAARGHHSGAQNGAHGDPRNAWRGAWGAQQIGLQHGGGNFFTAVVSVFKCEPDPGSAGGNFPLEVHLAGSDGAHLRRIESECGARVKLREGDDGCMEIEISATSSGSLDTAVRLANWRVETTYEEYMAWLKQRDRGQFRSKQARSKATKSRVRFETRGQHRMLSVFQCDDPDFGLREKLTGVDNMYLQHIETTTGTKVSLKEDWESFMPEYVEITGVDEHQLNHAQKLVKDLIQSAEEQYVLWTAQKDNEEVVSELVDVFDCADERFDLRSRLVGSSCKLRKIERKTGAQVSVEGDENDPCPKQLRISAKSEDVLESAREPVLAFLDNLNDEHRLWKGEDVEGALKTVLKMPKSFAHHDVREWLLGHEGENLRHIQKETGARVVLQGGTPGDPARFEVASKKPEALGRALELAADLIQAVTGTDDSAADDLQGRPRGRNVDRGDPADSGGGVKRARDWNAWPPDAGAKRRS